MSEPVHPVDILKSGHQILRCSMYGRVEKILPQMWIVTVSLWCKKKEITQGKNYLCKSSVPYMVRTQRVLAGYIPVLFSSWPCAVIPTIA